MFDFILRPFKLLWSRDREYYRILKNLFGLYPNNIDLYKLALIHKSASLFLEDGTPMNNERLEFLGDAILESIVSDYLFIEFPECGEGFLTQVRAKIVSRNNLNYLCKRIGLDKYLIAQNGGSYYYKNLYGDALEAMIGAIYLDQGYDFVNRLMINDILAKYINLKLMASEETDFKSRMLEWGQKNKIELTFETKPDEDSTPQLPHFCSKLYVGGEEIASGDGSSKKEAEQTAAHNGLNKINTSNITHHES